MVEFRLSSCQSASLFYYYFIMQIYNENMHTYSIELSMLCMVYGNAWNSIVCKLGNNTNGR
jgi:hypothetical protein